jgi:hypothetical protein
VKIENLISEKKGNRARVAATVSWEDCDRPTDEVYFETEEAFAQDLTCNPHAFLLACAIPAIHYGEERIVIDAEICPGLRQCLMTVMSWFRHWYYGPEHKLTRIEAKTRSSLPTPRTPGQAGSFFSGGIDSFATMRLNRLNFPLEHPWSIKDGLLICGVEVYQPEAFKHVVNSLSGVAQEIGITLIPVYTNIYEHYRAEDAPTRSRFWLDEFGGSALAAVAHAFARRLTITSIPASDDIANLHPEGTHPLIDPNYSSSDLQIRHDGVALSRFTKTKLVAEWDVALQNLRVCNRSRYYQPDSLNCGQCEKCVRTMLELLALGLLDKTYAFPRQDVSSELVRSLVKMKPTHVHFYKELLPFLAEKGRHDLVRAIEHKIAESHDLHWKTLLKRFDRKYLSGSLATCTKPIFS